MSDWGMKFEDDYVPRFGRRLPEGDYLVEVASGESRPNDAQNKGDNVLFTFKVVNGPEAGGTVRSTLYVLNDNFSGNDNHAGATKDNWYNLLVCTGIKPQAFGDMREVSRALVGKRLGVTVSHSQGKGANSDKTYANVASYMSAEAVGGVGTENDNEDDGVPLSSLA